MATSQSEAEVPNPESEEPVLFEAEMKALLGTKGGGNGGGAAVNGSGGGGALGDGPDEPSGPAGGLATAVPPRNSHIIPSEHKAVALTFLVEPPSSNQVSEPKAGSGSKVWSNANPRCCGNQVCQETCTKHCPHSCNQPTLEPVRQTWQRSRKVGMPLRSLMRCLHQIKTETLQVSAKRFNTWQ